MRNAGLLVFCVFVALSCSFTGINRVYIHLIDFDGFGDKNRDRVLAEGVLMSNPHDYLSKKVPSLTREEVQRISIGYFLPTNKNDVQFRVVLPLDLPNVEARKDTILQLLEERLKKLAAEQVEKEKTFPPIRKAAENWYGLIDAGNYEAAWNQMHEFGHTLVSREDFLAMVKKDRIAAGKLLTRGVRNKCFFLEEPNYKYLQGKAGSPTGDFVIIEFKTKFENHPKGHEFVELWKSPEGKWMVVGFRYWAG